MARREMKSERTQFSSSYAYGDRGRLRKVMMKLISYGTGSKLHLLAVKLDISKPWSRLWNPPSLFLKLSDLSNFVLPPRGLSIPNFPRKSSNFTPRAPKEIKMSSQTGGCQYPSYLFYFPPVISFFIETVKRHAAFFSEQCRDQGPQDRGESHRRRDSEDRVQRDTRRGGHNR